MLTLSDYKKYLQFSLEEYKEFQFCYLQKFVHDVSKNSKFYKSILPKGEIKSYDDFSKLPLLEQEDLRVRDIEEFRATAWEKICTVTRSSGTTGQSKIVLWTHEALEWEKKWGALGFLLGKIKKDSKYAILMPLEMSRIPSFVTVCKSLGATAIPIGRIVTDSDEENAIELIKRIKATHVLATPTRLFSIGNRIKNSGLDFKTDFHIKYLATGGMHATDIQKKTLEKLWGAELYEQSGANELGFTGFECEAHNGLHILPGSHYIEVIDQKTRQPITDNISNGEVLVTSFSNLGTPLMRYRIGDIGSISYERCRCGLSFPRLFIKGRTMGTISIGGTKLYSYQIENVLSGFIPQITLQYKVTINKVDDYDLINISIESPNSSLKDKYLPSKIVNAFMQDSSSMYETMGKIKDGKLKIKVEILPIGSLTRSNGDKIKDQFVDLRNNF